MAQTGLITEEDRVRLLANALADERDHAPVVKLFTPDASATWLITECDPDEPDRLSGCATSALAIQNWAMSASLKSWKPEVSLASPSSATSTSLGTGHCLPMPRRRVSGDGSSLDQAGEKEV
jgi:hypothetical protein